VQFVLKPLKIQLEPSTLQANFTNIHWMLQ